LIAALAALDAERHTAGSHITNLGDALWWAATTVTTVGYGDTVPITGTGKLIAAALMLVGISLVGAVTATIAAWFIAQTRDVTQAEEADLAARLTRIEASLAEIHQTLHPAPARVSASASRDARRHGPPNGPG
jgi:voltage-gated potassium channel